MKTVHGLEWNEAVPSDLGHLEGRWLWVADGVIGHAAALPYHLSVEAGVEDYAAGYDAGDFKGEIEVEWELWVDGEQRDRGKDCFAVPQARAAQ